MWLIKPVKYLSKFVTDGKPMGTNRFSSSSIVRTEKRVEFSFNVFSQNSVRVASKVK